MDALKSSRKQHRRLFSKSCNDFDREESELSSEDKILKLKIIEEKAEMMIGVEEQIKQLLFEGEELDDIIDKEVDESEIYIDRWRILKQKLAYLYISEKDNSVTGEINVSHDSLLHYPKIKLPTFDGNVRNWLGFWGQFQKIDSDSNLDSHDKFAYLSQAMEKGTPAEELLKSFPPGGESYCKAIKQLQARFGREELLIEVYVRDLLSLVLNKFNSSKGNSLRKLYDQLETRLRALETLGVTRDKNAAMLFPLVESSLPDETLRAWERYRSAHRRSTGESISIDEQEISPKQETDLDHILSFLQDEVEAEERISLATQCFDPVKMGRVYNKRNSYSKTEESPSVPSATDLLTSAQGGEKTCIFCSNHHNSADCMKGRKMSLKERQTVVQKAHCCFLCLKPRHNVQNCKSKVNCLICGKRHNLLLCRSLPRDQWHYSNVKKNEQKEDTSQNDEALANISRGPNVLLQTLMVTLKGCRKKRTARAIIDSASQRTYILKSAAKEMGYEPTGREYLQHSLFGGSNTGVCNHDVFKVYLSNVSGTYNCNFDALSQTIICETIPPIGQGPWLQELLDCDVKLTNDRDGPIEILIGADVAGKLMTGGYKRLSCGLSAIETKLGWTVMGRNPEKTSKESATLVVTSMLNRDACITDLWTLDSLGITDPSERKTKFELHEAAKEHFLSTVKVENDRFMVHLPWIEDHPPLPDNYELALKRLNSTVNKLETEGLYQDYEDVFEEWLQEGIIEEVPENEITAPCHYLPHRHVVKDNSTTKLRPVFDASAKRKGFPSLNECLEKGLNLIELIPTIINRFRSEEIGVVADIKKAFLQISLFGNDKDFIRFLWKRSDGSLKFYRHCRVVFGISSSPFLLGIVIQHHLKSILKLSENGHLSYPTEIIKKLLRSFYVDNCVTSVKNEVELRQFIKVATDVMAERKFDLRGWEFTDPSLISSPTNVLGMLWNKSNDTLQVNMSNLEGMCFEKVTKRIILATAHKIFDPLGVTCPVVLVPKILLQRTWKMKINWDEEVDSDTKKKFLKWVKNISCLTNIEIPRWIRSGNIDESCSLHVFSDASRHAYATAIFIRVEMKDSVKVQLIQAKARVSPCGKRETSIARLELLGATIAARLASTIIKEFQIENVYFWTDSTTVLAWIRREEAWGVFVHNRVQEIRGLTQRGKWRFVPGIMNPADLPSRGCSALQLWTSKWWEGPIWLYFPKEQWPTTEINTNEEEVDSERKKKIVSSLLSMDVSSMLSTRFSKFRKTLKVMAWINRFLYNCRNKKKKVGGLTVCDLDVAEKIIVRLIQMESFEGTDDKRLRSLNVFYDDGIIKLKTGVFRREDDEGFRTPAVLPGEHPIVKSLVMQEHEKRGHGGVSYVLNALREKFWLLCGRRNVHSVLRTCVTCKRHLGKNVNPLTAPPPPDRVQDAAVFQVTGIDFAGPLLLRDKSKAWICLFTCAVYRAVHLELVTSMSTETFLQAFHRFVARRGKPSTVYSDNGTNFTGAANAFSSIDFDLISQEAREERITWKFIPPGAPWWGGWWERLIGLMKQILRKILGRACLSYEEMITVLCNCESILNDRPLTAVTSDSELSALTPANFVKDLKSYRVPDVYLTVDPNSLRRRLCYIQSVREAFRKRFRQEYLGVLQTKQKNHKISTVSVGDIVLVGADDKKRLVWPLGRIIELLPGADGVNRRARVKTQKGLLVRALQSLYPLEVSSSKDLTEEKSEESIKSVKRDNWERPEQRAEDSHTDVTKKLVATRVGRIIKPPKKLSL